ncbi:hypothetical protein K470DRAFT_244215 [Piedraia hortae CBS 480.64]|uniref:Uncharacterized protein n=1 Tax=Piedraia hortae CBS 480.64 TaxID=1314780 RepID=A0A6A7C5U5_9PEZI|nr:hypothetical protein K470DRAFT_244215 [Piedraia hortae CBS 480.64]
MGKDPRVSVSHLMLQRSLESLPGGTKRKAQEEIKICTKCKDAFSQSENDKAACRFLSGDLEPEDVWLDHDEQCHGPINRSENRRDHIEAFIYACCDKRGGEEGCMKGPHRVIGMNDLWKGGVIHSDEDDDDDEDEDKDEDEE